MTNSRFKLLSVPATLMIVPTIVGAMPLVSGEQLSWPSDGWYQVQNANTYQTVCEGRDAAISSISGGTCFIDSDRYIVINHTTGERFENITAEAPSNNAASPDKVDRVTVEGLVISWPDDGWYQVQSQADYSTICEGGTQCTVELGEYVVINHSTGERFNDIAVDGGASRSSSVVIEGNTLRWPDDGWYQVQSQADYSTVCEGGAQCQVSAGSYIVINHTSGERTLLDVASGGMSTDDLDQVITTRVTFDITVPAYQSNELQVRLVWGDIDRTAGWVGDELWSLSADFPIATEHPLTITFYDGNGDIELGSYAQNYETGSNTAEFYQVSTDQFDTARWDADGDGTSNLDELISGTDPLVDDGVLVLEHEQYFGGAYFTRGNLAKEAWDYESSIPALPYSQSFEEIIPVVYPDPLSNAHLPGKTDILTIDIDENGTGSYYEYYWYNDQSDVTNRTEEAARTNTGSSIVWSGTYLRTNSSAGTRAEREFTVETEVIEGQAGNPRRQAASIYTNDRGRSSARYSYDLTGLPVEGTQLCEPITGTFVDQQIPWVNNRVYHWTSVTVTKEPGDQYWNVSQQVTACGRLSSLTEPDPECTVGEIRDRYLVTSLGENFYCGFLGLE